MAGSRNSGRDADDVQKTLFKTRISLDLLKAFRARKKQPEAFPVIIEFNRSFPGGTTRARLRFLSVYSRAKKVEIPTAIPAQIAPQIDALEKIDDEALVNTFAPADKLDIAKSMWTDNYVFGVLTQASILEFSTASLEGAALVYKIWSDQPIERYVYTSRRTVKCDAAIAAFAAGGKGVVWAVADSGIDGRHQHFHFQDFKTLEPPDGLLHHDFTATYKDERAASDAALIDEDGHGTHVAGIIAGASCIGEGPNNAKVASFDVQANARDKQNASEAWKGFKGPITGTAPECKLLSLKVLKTGTVGELSSLLAAIGYVQKANEYGRHLKIHGLNLSLGYLFNPESFASGQSPLCIEVDRLVLSGVCVVVAAGNGGYGTISTFAGKSERAAHLCTIADPGNATLAITVGSTHRDMPHTYGVSYFSAKGPTADGRMKPDLVAPGERIVSCALSTDESLAGGAARFKEDSGTSMAAPHVSGAIAAFLSVRQEFKGKPQAVRDIFTRSATDLKRRPEFQGAGLLDLMRALQIV